MEFDKTIFMNNITYLLKRRNIKIGDLENKIGVSKGYISRINKKSDGVAAGVDIVYKIALALEVSVDVLISVDLQTVDDNEVYLLNLLKSFQKKTENREVFWNKIDLRTIGSMLAGKEYTDIPMLHTHPDDRNERYDDYEYISRKIYVSSFLGTGLDLGNDNDEVGPWFSMKIDDLNTVYITDVMKYSYEGNRRRFWKCTSIILSIMKNMLKMEVVVVDINILLFPFAVVRKDGGEDRCCYD